MQLNATPIPPQPLGQHDTAFLLETKTLDSIAGAATEGRSQGASTSRPWTCPLATSW